ncbi:MAG: cell division protein ZapD [Gammaproteobacteria bacterium]|jgi:cell division protein ZapD|nr:cell division protein ZapD [Gammaproteobacteria bacterium]
MREVTYEQPLNERIRTFLRLEFLFHQMDHTISGHATWDSRATIDNLIEILNVFSRGDVKTELIKELERLAATLSRLEANPDVDREKLEELLARIDDLVDRLYRLQGQIGQELKENEFLNAIKQRSSIPGGTCDFDLPAYHHWLQKPATERDAALRQWLAPFHDFRAAIDLTLGLVRESGHSTREVAESGFYQQSLDTAIPYQLIRVTLPAEVQCFAEISGGKHRFTVRMMEMRNYGRPAQSTSTIPFVLECCAF